MKIKLIDYGTGFRVGDNIFINRCFLKDIGVFSAILQHELNHTSGYSIKDLVLEITNYEIRPVRYRFWKLMITNPSTWWSFSPLLRINGKMTIDPAIFSFWVFTLIIGGYLVKKWMI